MLIRRPYASLAAVALLFSAGCATHYIDGPRPETAEIGPALWQVTDDDTKVYLFGTVHALPPGTPWFRGKIARAFSESDELVTEVDLRPADDIAGTLAKAGTLPKGSNLRELMSEETRQKFEMALVSVSLPIEALDDKQPWLAAMTLSLVPVLQAGYQQSSGVEHQLMALAAAKKHDALETVGDQIEVFQGLSQDAQLRYLDRVVDGLGNSVTSLDGVVANWMAGDANELSSAMNAELSDSELHERLLTKRNANWAQWIVKRMEEPGTVFVAVGAGHLAGTNSVQDRLKANGLAVSRVWE